MYDGEVHCFRCGEKCKTIDDCMVNVAKYCMSCGEMKKIACSRSSDPEALQCDTKCTEQLPCGHRCEGTCYKWYDQVGFA